MKELDHEGHETARIARADALEVQSLLIEWTVANSGAEDRRYLGMSGISKCPLYLYRQMTGTRVWTMQEHLNCYSGYLFERDVKSRLVRIGVMKFSLTSQPPGNCGSERELIAEFDNRYRGHTDGETWEGDLVEIKSTVQPALDRIVMDSRLPSAHFSQVQTYMRHGGYERALVVYVARDTGALHVEHIRFIPSTADRLDEKAKRILAAVDAGTPPACTCGRCNNDGRLK